MQTIQINNPEIEEFISSQYGNDTQTLLNDFVSFVKLSLDDAYPAISKEDAKRRVALAIKEVQKSEALLLSEEEYNKEIDEFMSSL